MKVKRQIRAMAMTMPDNSKEHIKQLIGDRQISMSKACSGLICYLLSNLPEDFKIEDAVIAHELAKMSPKAKGDVK
jgi:hypothetical protein